MKLKKVYLIIICIISIILLMICSSFYINEMNRNIIQKEDISTFLTEKYNEQINVLREYKDTENYIVIFYTNSRIHFAKFERTFLNYYRVEGIGTGTNNRFGIELVDKKYLISDKNNQVLKILYAGVIHNSDAKQLLVEINDSTHLYDLENTFLIYKEFNFKITDRLRYKVLLLDQNSKEVVY